MAFSKWPKDVQDELQQLSDLMHLFHHRNRNQHSGSVWWRHCSIFRRQLAKLVGEIKMLNEVPTTNLARMRKKSEDIRTLHTIECRLSFWQDVLLTKWFPAFSQVVADGRFAVLGLVLLSILAQATSRTGLITRMEDRRQIEVENALNAFAQEDWGLDETVILPHARLVEDLGEAIQRSPQNDGTASNSPHATQPESKPPNAQSHQTQALEQVTKKSLQRPAKKRKTKNAIDSLFDNI